MDLSFSRSPQIFLSPEVHGSFFLQKSTYFSFYSCFSQPGWVLLTVVCPTLLEAASMMLHVLFSPVSSFMYNAVFRLRLIVKENLHQWHTMSSLSFGWMLGRSVYLLNVNVTETSMRVCWHVQLSFTCHCISKQQMSSTQRVFAYLYSFLFLLSNSQLLWHFSCLTDVGVMVYE